MIMFSTFHRKVIFHSGIIWQTSQYGALSSLRWVFIAISAHFPPASYRGIALHFHSGYHRDRLINLTFLLRGQPECVASASLLRCYLVYRAISIYYWTELQCRGHDGCRYDQIAKREGEDLHYYWYYSSKTRRWTRFCTILYCGIALGIIIVAQTSGNAKLTTAVGNLFLETPSVRS